MHLLEKWHKIFICVLILLNITSIVHAGRAPGTCSTGSVHDMTQFAGVAPDPYGRICIFCHTPHNAVPGLPLWNRTDNALDPGWQSYIWSAPANLPISIPDPLEGPTRMCMSCHDGTIAVDAHGGVAPDNGSVVMGTSAAIGKDKDLSNSHPVGFSYVDALSRRGSSELVDVYQPFATAMTTSDTAGTYNTITRNGNKKIKDVLYLGEIMTCASCHDVHNCENAVPDPGHNYNYLLWAKEEQSLICLSCHVK